MAKIETLGGLISESERKQNADLNYKKETIDNAKVNKDIFVTLDLNGRDSETKVAMRDFRDRRFGGIKKRARDLVAKVKNYFSPSLKVDRDLLLKAKSLEGQAEQQAARTESQVVNLETRGRQLDAQADRLQDVMRLYRQDQEKALYTDVNSPEFARDVEDVFYKKPKTAEEVQPAPEGEEAEGAASEQQDMKEMLKYVRQMGGFIMPGKTQKLMDALERGSLTFDEQSELVEVISAFKNPENLEKIHKGFSWKPEQERVFDRLTLGAAKEGRERLAAMLEEFGAKSKKYPDLIQNIRSGVSNSDELKAAYSICKARDWETDDEQKKVLRFIEKLIRVNKGRLVKPGMSSTEASEEEPLELRQAA